MVTNGRRQRLRLALAVCVSAFMTLMSAAIQPASAQEFRGTVTGTVTDPGGLPLPGATVTAVNTTTNETATAVTSGDGLYNLPFLKPGLYTLTVELEGFRKHTQDKVQLEVGSTITLAIQMQIGSISETVTVVSEAVEATKADRGMVIDNMRVTELPLNARNPFMLSYLAPGITYNGPAIYQRPFDNGAIADWSINGGAEPQQRVPARRRAEQLDPGRQQHRLRAAGRRGAGVQDRHQQLRRAVRPHRRRRRQRVAEVGHERPARHGLRVPAPQVAGLDRVLPQGEQPAEAGSQARSVRLRDRRPGADPRPLRRHGQDVLHVRVRRLQGGDAEPGHLHGAGRSAAARRLQQPARRAGPPDHHLRSGDRPPRERPVGARSVPGQRHPDRPHQPDRAQI